MTPAEAIKRIEQGKIAPVYFLYGEERFFQIEVLNALNKAIVSPENEEFNRETFDAASSAPSDWLQSAQTLSFFGGKKLIAVRDFHETTLSKPAVEKILTYLENPSPDGVLVLFADKIDRKKKIYKSLASMEFAVACTAPNEGSLIQWIGKRAQKVGYTLKSDASSLLVDRIGAKPGLLVSELEKLAVSAGKSKVIDEALVAELVGALKQENVFELTDALKKKNAAEAILILRNQLRHGEEPLKILGTITWQYRLIWEVKHYVDKKTPIRTAASLMGAKPFMIEKAAGYCGNFSVDDLKKAFKKLFQADQQLKTGGGSPELVMETLILRLCSARGN